jgi:hypothetical protein
MNGIQEKNRMRRIRVLLIGVMLQAITGDGVLAGEKQKSKIDFSKRGCASGIVLALLLVGVKCKICFRRTQSVRIVREGHFHEAFHTNDVSVHILRSIEFQLLCSVWNYNQSRQRR